MFRIGKMETSIGSRVFNVLNGRQKMKKIFVYMASAALVFAASCNKIEEANTPVDTPAETELITVELNPQTKTSLKDMSTVWTEDDAVSVTANGTQIGTLTLVSGSTFKGTITAGLDGETVVTLNYPAGVTEVPATQEAKAGSFANGAALLEGTTTVAKLRAKEGATLENTTALLQFSVAQAGDVTFEVGTTEYTVTGCKTGETYYACVAPATAAFTARIDGYLSKQAAKNVTFTANKIANLGALPAPVKSAWGVVGLNGDWDNDIAMYNDIDGYFVAKNLEIKSTDEFKLRKDAKWDESIAGGITAPDTKREAGWVNMTVSKAGTYDVYCKGSNYYIMTQGKFPTEAGAPGPIEITVTYSGDTNRNYIHIWSDGGEIANSMQCTSSNPFTWKVTVPDGDQQKRDYQFILKQGSGWGSYQTADSEKLCLRNPMPLKIVGNKVTHY